MEKLIENLLKKEMNEQQKKRLVKLIIEGIETKEERKIETIKKGLYNLEFQL